MALRDLIRILVVDDMSVSRGLILQALDSFGIRHVASAENGKLALKALFDSPAHLVISDYNMPEMDGLQLLHRMRSLPETQNIGFVLITGRADQQIIEQGRQLRMNNFLPKPFTQDDLRHCIETVVGRL